jgi:hypothetical protein
MEQMKRKTPKFTHMAVNDTHLLSLHQLHLSEYSQNPGGHPNSYQKGERNEVLRIHHLSTGTETMHERARIQIHV